MLLKGAGATFPAPLYQRWFQDYGKQHAVVVAYDAVGSGEGIRRFLALDKDLAPDELVDFGASDAAMSDADMDRVTRGAELLPMTAGAVVLAYNLPGFEGELRLSREALAGIFLGEITSWNDAKIQGTNREKLPDLTIGLVTRRDSSGTTFAFTNHLAAISPRWRDRFGAATAVDFPGAAMRASGNEGVAGRINQAHGTIGYVQYGFAARLGLKMAAIENKAGRFISPTHAGTTAALAGARLPQNLRLFFSDPDGPDSYPIVTLTWVLLYKDYADARKTAALRELFAWCLTDGQSRSEELGYARLPANVISAASLAVHKIGAR